MLLLVTYYPLFLIQIKVLLYVLLLQLVTKVTKELREQLEHKGLLVVMEIKEALEQQEVMEHKEQ